MPSSLEKKYPDIDFELRLKQNVNRATNAFLRKAFRPSKFKLSLLDWAQSNVRLKGARPGLLDLSLTPHMIEPYRCADFNNKVNDIVLMLGSQMGKSTFCEVATGFYITIGTGNIGYAAANDELLERIRETRINAILEQIPEIRDKLQQVREEKGSKKAKDSIKLLNFGNAYLCFMSLQSTTAMSNIDCQILVLEEVRDAPINLKNQGCPVKIIDKRRSTYDKRSKRLIPSTPSIRNDQDAEANCKVWREFQEGTQEYWKVPCPHCGHYHQLHPAKAVIDEAREIFGFSCPECGGLIEEKHRDDIVIKGQYFASNPKMLKKFRSFHCNQFMTRQGIGPSWEKNLRAWVKAQDKEAELITYTNTVLGLPYSKVDKEADWEKLSKNRSTYVMGSLPEEAILLCAGVDFQKTWIEASIWGYDAKGCDYFCDRLVFPNIDWNNIEGTIAPVLARLVSMTIKSGPYERPITAIYLDAGFNAESIARAWSMIGSPRQMAFVKGESKHKDSRTYLGDTMIQNGQLRLKVSRVNTYQSKVDIYNNYVLDKAKPGYNYYPTDCPDEIFQQLTSEIEVLDVKSKNRVWKRRSNIIRNEVLDCKVYASLAYSMVLAELQNTENLVKFAESQIRPYNINSGNTPQKSKGVLKVHGPSED